MAWNEPGGNKPRDPWGSGGGGSGGQGPDMDEMMRQMRERFAGFFGGSGGGSGAPWLVILVVLALIYGFWAAFTVDAPERAVVLSFGKYSRTVGPGLNWHLPPFERYYKVNVDDARSFELREEMLTRDTNIVSVHLEVQYHVVDPEMFLLRTSRPEDILQHATASALRQVVGNATMDDVLIERRGEIGAHVDRLLENYLERYRTGLEVIKTVLKGTAAPQEVRDAFDDVAKAKEDEDRLKNEAEAYANRVVPEARGQADRLLEEARAYREQRVARARGDADRFLALLTEYRRAPDVTRQRLYLETMEEVLANVSKVLVDVDQGNSMIYLPLDRIVRERGADARSERAGTAGAPSSAPVVRDPAQNSTGYGSRTREFAR